MHDKRCELHLPSVSKIVHLFAYAASRRVLVLYSAFHQIFDEWPDIEKKSRYRTLERSLRLIQSSVPHFALYSSLFAVSREDNLPRDGFYSSYMTAKNEEFEEMAGRMSLNTLMSQENRDLRTEICHKERELVHEHAKENFDKWILD